LVCFNFFSFCNPLGKYIGNISVGKIRRQFTDKNILLVLPFVFIDFLVVFHETNKTLKVNIHELLKSEFLMFMMGVNFFWCSCFGILKVRIWSYYLGHNSISHLITK
jgi:hypothetical protein